MPIRFQVDADFYDHPKSIGMSDAAVALWTRAGSYSAAKLSDGFIAEHVLATLSRVPDEAAAELVARGLWRRVRGGFRFHQWDQRNLTRTRVEADREYDRARKRRGRAGQKADNGDADDGLSAGRSPDAERKRRDRHAARQSAGRKEQGQVGGHIVRPESQPESNRNPNGIRPLSVSVSESVSESVSGSGRGADAGPEPPDRCPEHIGDPNPPRCGACADARRAHEAWHQAHLAAEAAARSAAAHDHAATVRAAIDACRLCDSTGYRAGALCHHDQAVTSRTTRGAAAARAALNRKAATSTPAASPEVPKQEDPQP